MPVTTMYNHDEDNDDNNDNNDDDEQSIQSLLSILTDSLKVHLGVAANAVATTAATATSYIVKEEDEDSASASTSTNRWLDEKQENIRHCLNGNTNDAGSAGTKEQVDLWQLRQLALTRGGLISSEWRKRAWPKLVAAHDQILLQQQQQQQSSQQSQQVAVSTASILLLKKDIAQTVWNVEHHVARQREEESLALQRSSRQLGLPTPRKVSFAAAAAAAAATATDQKIISFQGLPDLKEANSTDTLSPTNKDTVSIPHNITSSSRIDDAYDMGSVGTFSPATTTTTTTLAGTADTYGSVPRRAASRTEQKVLFNIIVSVLRQPPIDCSSFEDDRYKYYRGLTDMAALLLIHLESPSLTSLVLGKLATHHLRDAMRTANHASTKTMTTTTTSSSTTTSTKSNPLLQTAIQLMLGPLLQHVDAELHATLLFETSTATICLVAPWIQGWFCQQLTDVHMASRLMDVFLVSHAAMPIYFCAAFLCHPLNRAKLLAVVDGDEDTTISHKAKMYHRLRMLPLLFRKQQQQQQEEAASITSLDTGGGHQRLLSNVLEAMIEMALDYMKQYPPHELLLSSSSEMDATAKHPVAQLSSIAMLQNLPKWATTDTAPTDYAVLQQAKAMRAAAAAATTTTIDNGSDAKQQQATTTILNSKQTISSHALQLQYPKAFVATGGFVNDKSTSSKRSRAMLVLGMLLVVIVATGGFVLNTFGGRAVPAMAPQIVVASAAFNSKTIQQEQQQQRQNKPATHDGHKNSKREPTVREKTPVVLAVTDDDRQKKRIPDQTTATDEKKPVVTATTGAPSIQARGNAPTSTQLMVPSKTTTTPFVATTNSTANIKPVEATVRTTTKTAAKSTISDIAAKPMTMTDTLNQQTIKTTTSKDKPLVTTSHLLFNLTAPITTTITTPLRKPMKKSKPAATTGTSTMGSAKRLGFLSKMRRKFVCTMKSFFGRFHRAQQKSGARR